MANKDFHKAQAVAETPRVARYHTGNVHIYTSQAKNKTVYVADWLNIPFFIYSFIHHNYGSTEEKKTNLQPKAKKTRALHNYLCLPLAQFPSVLSVIHEFLKLCMQSNVSPSELLQTHKQDQERWSLNFHIRERHSWHDTTSVLTLMMVHMVVVDEVFYGSK